MVRVGGGGKVAGGIEQSAANAARGRRAARCRGCEGGGSAVVELRSWNCPCNTWADSQLQCSHCTAKLALAENSEWLRTRRTAEWEWGGGGGQETLMLAADQ